jgi:hypothetical protein
LEAIDYYTHLSNYSTYLYTSGTALLTREVRLPQELDYSSYYELVREQRLRSPSHPKWEPDISPPTYTDLSLREAIQHVLQGRYTYVSTRKIPYDIYENLLQLEQDTLYNDVNVINDSFISGDSSIYSLDQELDTELYWEFYSSSIDGDPHFSRYLYIPINPSLSRFLKDLLPFIFNWDVRPTKPIIWMDYPHQLYVRDNSATDWPCHYNLVTDDLYHPFHKGFLFSGKAVLNADGSVLYEYTDKEALYGIENQLYLSALLPIGMDFPLGQPIPGSLIYDPCLDHLIDLYPSYGYLPYVGSFTGYITTTSYNSYQTYYLYKRLDGSTFLSPAPPDTYSRALINIGLELYQLSEGGLQLHADMAIDSIEVIDRSRCGINLSIRDSLCRRSIPLSLTLFNNCNLIDDQYGKRKDIELVDDGQAINDDFIFDNGFCKEHLESPFRDLLEDCLVNDINFITNEFLMEDCIDG